jgi:Family of unknown function (DUF5681)
MTFHDVRHTAVGGSKTPGFRPPPAVAESIYGKYSLQNRNVPMARKKRLPTGRYRIGYCKPPKRTRFKRGTSGNPKGRKKGSRNRVNADLAMDELVRIMKSERSPAATRLKAAKLILFMAQGPPPMGDWDDD